jgi:hypothetical protein
MRRLPGLTLTVVLAAAGCATPPPPTAGAPATLESVATYRSCAWDHLKPLQASNVSDSPMGVALMAEAACGQQRETVRSAVLAENAAHPRADDFATSYAMEARRLILAEMAESLLKRP